MWTLCKELKGTESLNEQGPFPYGKVISPNFHTSETWMCVNACTRWSCLVTWTARLLFRISKRRCFLAKRDAFPARCARTEGATRSTFIPELHQLHDID